MRRRTLLASLPAWAMAAATGRGSGAPVSLRVSVGPFISMCPFFVAYEGGYFKDAGFDIEVHRDPGSLQTVPLFVGGALDVALLAVSAPFLNAVARGARIRIVAGREVATAKCRPPGTIYVRRESYPHGIQDLRLLRGKRVAVSGSLGGPIHFDLDVLLEHAGMHDGDVEVVGLKASESVAALHSGAVEAFVSSSIDYGPMLDRLQLVAGPSLADVLPDFQYSYIMFGPALLDADVGVGARFLRTYLRGVTEFRGGRTPAFMDEFARSNGYDPKLLRASCREGLARDGEVRMKDLQYYIDWSIRKGFCPAGMNAAACVDGRYLAAMREKT